MGRMGNVGMAITMGYGLWGAFSSLHELAGPQFHTNNGDDAEPHIGLA